MSAILPQVTDATFQAEVIDSPLPALADLWAEWCEPCKRLAPVLEEIATECAGRLKVVKLDADANPAVPGNYGVQGLPTLLLFKGGQVVETIVGFQPKDRLLHTLEPHLR